LEEWKSLPSSRLYDFYAEKAKHPKGRRSFRHNLCSKGHVRIIEEEESTRLLNNQRSGNVESET